jgi:hypothetical protein
MKEPGQRIGLFLAGPMFAGGLALMQPQISALAGLEGQSVFLRSIATQAEAWTNGHLLLLAAAVLYLFAGLSAGRLIAGRQKIIGPLVQWFFAIGAIGLAGNFALDFVYGALAQQLDIDAAQAARSALLSDSTLQLVFAQAGPGVFLLGMLVVALSGLVAGWLPRVSGALILAGWAIVMGLHGVFPYAEALGHFVVGTGFWVIGIHSLRSRPGR